MTIIGKVLLLWQHNQHPYQYWLDKHLRYQLLHYCQFLHYNLPLPHHHHLQYYLLSHLQSSNGIALQEETLANLLDNRIPHVMFLPSILKQLIPYRYHIIYPQFNITVTQWVSDCQLEDIAAHHAKEVLKDSCTIQKMVILKYNVLVFIPFTWFPWTSLS